MREGLSIKGLTTAASILGGGLPWAGGRRGILRGGADRRGRRICDLDVFEVVQRKMNVGRHATLALSMECSDLSGVMHA